MYLDACFRFLEHLRVIKNASEHTVRNYAIDLNALKNFLEIDIPLDQRTSPISHRSLHEKPANDTIKLGNIDRKLLRGFLASLHAEGQNKRTIVRRLSSLRSFFKYAVSQKLIENNPTEELETLKLDKKLPIFLSYDQVKRLFDQPDTDTLLGFRDRTIMELFYSSGLRLSELVALDRCDFNSESMTLKLKGKGKKERLVPITKNAAAWITAYLNHNERIKEVDEAIFLNKFGMRLSARSIDRNFEKYLKESGLSGQITPHSLRHAIATAWLENGMDLKTIQLLLGHSSLATTTIYTHVSNKQKKTVYDKTHPRA